VAAGDWDRLRRTVYQRAGHRCEICGASREDGARLEAHERWSYQSATRVQRLVRLLCLCSACHEVTHFGLAEVRGRGKPLWVI
jgi:predicted restriction endonuclease